MENTGFHSIDEIIDIQCWGEYKGCAGRQRLSDEEALAVASAFRGQCPYSVQWDDGANAGLPQESHGLRLI